MRGRLDRLGPSVALIAITGTALLVRLVGLGARVAHQDEARVASWILHYVAVDAWEYRPIIHGPFLPHVNGVVFELLGPSDFSMRLVVAVVGGLLPLSAWLFRERLRDRSVVFLGALLAFNPVLLYYSRFMRNDVLLGAFAFLAAGFLVRTIDTGRGRYLLGAGLALGLALTTKENALLYPVTWAGALVLLLDQRLFLARYGKGNWWHRFTSVSWNALMGVWRVRYAALAGTFTLLAVAVAFYAPKPELYQALGDPGRLPGVIEAATRGSWEQFVDLWGSTGMQEHSYVAFLAHLLGVLAVGGLTTTVFAAIGFLADRYRADGPSDLVGFAFFWGLASLLGYPVVSDIQSGWTAVHVLVPLAIPAAVGLEYVFERAVRAVRRNQQRTAAVALLLLLGGGTVLAGSGVAVNAVYPTDDRNPVVQYAQPAGEMKPTLAEIESLAAETEGIDVLFYGEEFYNPTDRERQPTLDIETGGYTGWFNRLPLPWYLQQYDARVASTKTPETITEVDPPVVITLREDAADISAQVEGYREVEHQAYLYDRPIVFYIES